MSLLHDITEEEDHKEKTNKSSTATSQESN